MLHNAACSDANACAAETTSHSKAHYCDSLAPGGFTFFYSTEPCLHPPPPLLIPFPIIHPPPLQPDLWGLPSGSNTSGSLAGLGGLAGAGAVGAHGLVQQQSNSGSLYLDSLTRPPAVSGGCCCRCFGVD